MNYAMRMLAVVGWVWAAIFGVFLLTMMKKRPRRPQAAKEDAKN